MLPIRIIARLDLKGDKLIKGIHLEGWRRVGAPNERGKEYYEQGIDELIYLDVVANLYNRDMLVEIIKEATKNIFIPLTVGGGVKTLDDAYRLLQAGADKVAINTAAVKSPKLITEISGRFGKQCAVSSIEAKKNGAGKWEVYIDSGREAMGKDVVEWAKEAVRLGAGELLLTSIDQDGTGKGFDIDLYKAISKVVNVPVIASGGFGQSADLVGVVNEGKVSAVSVAQAFHYGKVKVSDLREEAQKYNIMVRVL